MPWDVIQRNGKWVVLGRDGHVFGTHPTRKDALKQQRALYSAEGKRSHDAK